MVNILRRMLFLPVLICFLSGCAYSGPVRLVRANLSNLLLTAVNSVPNVPSPARTCARIALSVIK